MPKGNSKMIAEEILQESTGAMSKETSRKIVKGISKEILGKNARNISKGTLVNFYMH